MSILPDPVEMASDELAQAMAQNFGDTLPKVAQLIAGFPEARRSHGGIRLLGEHMAECHARQASVDLSAYSQFDPAMAQKAAAEAIAAIAPREGMVLPIFGPRRQGYRLTRRIAAGAFGSVWAAAADDGTSVGVKTPWTDDAGSQPWQLRVELLAEEAAMLAELNHPNIIRHIATLHDAGGVAYPVTELLAEGDLASQPLPMNLELAVQRTAQIAEAVDYLRTKAVVHRDITLRNIGLDADGNPKLFDFGLAVRVAHRQMHEGERAGTPGHLTPEQLFGTSSQLGCRTDVAAIGIILYQLVTGQSPFPDRSTEAAVVDWMSAQLQQVASSPQVPAVLHPILRQCFAYHQESRYPTAGHLAKALYMVHILSPLQAWWAGRSAGIAARYIDQVSKSLAALRSMPPAKLDPNAIMMVLLDGVGVIEEYERLERQLPGLTRGLPAQPQLLDPRRRLRTRVPATDFPQIDAGLVELCRECQHRAETAQQLATGSVAPASDLFEIARLVHGVACQAEYPEQVGALTSKVGFPDSLAAGLRTAWHDRTRSEALEGAVAAFDAHAEAVLS